MRMLMSDEIMRHNMSSCALVDVHRFQMDEIAERWRRLFEKAVSEE